MGSAQSAFNVARRRINQSESMSDAAQRPGGKYDVHFDDFQILRAIGKGSFGKVCIVQKRDSNQMYAMKYMNKLQCLQKDAFRNVLREIQILSALEHPFLVNLWFTFQDEEDMFMVVDLLLGGDLRYHLQQEVAFDEQRVAFYISEISLALDYLRKHRILHRDIKPDNILLDESGHIHITDFNIASVLKDGELATSMSGTKPYMAPEVFECALDHCSGYSFPADWWSLGVCAYEMLCGQRPYDIHSGTPLEEVRQMMRGPYLPFPSHVSSKMVLLVQQLLCFSPLSRLTCVADMKGNPYMAKVDFEAVKRREANPPFVPSKDQLNCDPTFELEEMIIEARPLHKKKKRLMKQNSRRAASGDNKPISSSLSGEDVDALNTCLESIEKQFIIYNRERELERLALEKKEREWEAELKQAMDDAT